MTHKISFYSHKAGAKRVRGKTETADIVSTGVGPDMVSFTAYVGDRYTRVYIDRAAIAEAYQRMTQGSAQKRADDLDDGLIALAEICRYHGIR